MHQSYPQDVLQEFINRRMHALDAHAPLFCGDLLMTDPQELNEAAQSVHFDSLYKMFSAVGARGPLSDVQRLLGAVERRDIELIAALQARERLRSFTIGGGAFGVRGTPAGESNAGIAIPSRTLFLDGRPLAQDPPAPQAVQEFMTSWALTESVLAPAATEAPSPAPAIPRPVRRRTNGTRIGKRTKMSFLIAHRHKAKPTRDHFKLRLIEAALRAHPGVASVAVVTQKVGGREFLFAHVVEATHERFTLEMMQTHCSKRLPQHLIPSFLTKHTAMPTVASGRIDRAALERGTPRMREIDTPFAAPVGDAEIRIAALIAERLNLDVVGRDDDFFSLGGRASQAIDFLADVTVHFRDAVKTLEIHAGEGALEEVFTRTPTPRDIAAALTPVAEPASVITRTQARLQCMRRGSESRHALVLFHGDSDGETLDAQALLQTLDLEQPFYSLAPQSTDAGSAPKTIEEMASEAVALIRSVQPHGPYLFAGYRNGGLIAYEAACILEKLGERVENLVLIAVAGDAIRYRAIKTACDALRHIPGIGTRVPDQAFLFLRRAHRAARKAAALCSQPQRLRSRLRTTWRHLDGHNKTHLDAQRRPMCELYVPRTYQGCVTLLWGGDDSYPHQHAVVSDWSRVVSEVKLALVDGVRDFIDAPAQTIADALFAPRGISQYIPLALHSIAVDARTPIAV